MLAPPFCESRRKRSEAANDRSRTDDRATSEGAEDVSDAAERRRRERAKSAERASRELEGYFGEFEYPVSSEDLAIEYGGEEIEMANETESLGSALDRLAGEEFDSPEEAREAVYGEITGQTVARPKRTPGEI